MKSLGRRLCYERISVAFELKVRVVGVDVEDLTVFWMLFEVQRFCEDAQSFQEMSPL